MSRFLGLLESHDKPLCRDTLVELIEDMLKTLESDAGRIDFEFPFFVKKSAPVSHLESLMNYRVRYKVESKGGVNWVIQTVTVPVTSLCPCSKEISAYGAHNQRSQQSSAALKGNLSLEQQIRYAEESASCELWSRFKTSRRKICHGKCLRKSEIC